jgi:hypothetical protein
MSCCGSTRLQLGAIGNTRPSAAPKPVAPRFTIVVEYVGSAALTAIGPVSGQRYRFHHAGARQVIDPRDRPGLVRIPQLREVI